MWIGVDLDELDGHCEIDEEEGEGREDDEVLTAVDDPTPEYLRKRL